MKSWGEWYKNSYDNFYEKPITEEQRLRIKAESLEKRIEEVERKLQGK